MCQAFCHTHSSLSRKLRTSMAGNCYVKIIGFEVLLIIPNKVILLWTRANKLLHSLLWCVYCSLSSEMCNTATAQHPQSAKLNESSHKLVPIDYLVFIIITCFHYEHNFRKQAVSEHWIKFASLRVRTWWFILLRKHLLWKKHGCWYCFVLPYAFSSKWQNLNVSTAPCQEILHTKNITAPQKNYLHFQFIYHTHQVIFTPILFKTLDPFPLNFLAFSPPLTLILQYTSP